MKADNIYRALKKILHIFLEVCKEKWIGCLRFYAHIKVTLISLFISGHRAKNTHCLYSKIVRYFRTFILNC